MNSLTLSLIALACIFSGTLLGIWLRTLLPEDHLSNDSKDAVKLGAGMIATLAALVIGLLIASAKGTFDTITKDLRQTAARLVLLDRVMAQYGPETREARELLRRNITYTIQRLWPEEAHKIVIAEARQPGKAVQDKLRPRSPEDDAQNLLQSANELESIEYKLRKLSPRNDSQRWLQSRALQVSTEIAEARWVLHGAVGQSSLPLPFLVVLICWLTIIFTSFGLFSPRNGTVISVMFICALSAASALFLILELDQPYHGFIDVSGSPLLNALAAMGQ